MRRQRPKPLLKRPQFWVLLALVFLIFVTAWLGVRGLIAKSNLEEAQGLISEMKTQALDFDVVGATATLGQITQHADTAVDMTSDVVWRGAEFIPWLGANLRVVRELSSVTGDIVHDVAAPLLGVADKLNPEALAPKDGAIDIQPFIDALPPVSRATEGARAATKAVKAIDTNGALGVLVAAKSKVAALLGTINPLLETLNSALPLLPPALGSETPRRYVVMFENPAEPRTLGGAALSFALVTLDHGHIELSATVPAGFENFPAYSAPVIPVPDGVEYLYQGMFGRFIANATARPSFISAAEITQANWTAKFGYGVDGVISIDPVALSYLLRATDPITLSSGDVLTSDSLVPLLLNGLYQRFNGGDPVEDNRAQDVVYSEAIAATFSRFTHGPFVSKLLVPAMMQAVSERRILLWSAHPEEQAQLVSTGLDGDLPKSDADTDRLGLYFQDNVGSKLEYYLTQSVRLSQAVCRADGRQSYRVTADLTSSVPVDTNSLSPSITGTFWAAEGLTPGVIRMFVYLYAAPGSQITGATIGGIPMPLEGLHDTDYPVGRVLVTLPPGATTTITYDVVAAEPGAKALSLNLTPLVNPTSQSVEPLDCSTVTLG